MPAPTVGDGTQGVLTECMCKLYKCVFLTAVHLNTHYRLTTCTENQRQYSVGIWKQHMGWQRLNTTDSRLNEDGVLHLRSEAGKALDLVMGQEASLGLCLRMALARTSQRAHRFPLKLAISWSGAKSLCFWASRAWLLPLCTETARATTERLALLCSH